MAVGYPEVPEERLREGGWDRRLSAHNEVFSGNLATVEARTVLYEHSGTVDLLDRAGVENPVGATDDAADTRFLQPEEGRLWHFFFASTVSFRPPLPPVVGTAAVFPRVLREARQSFAADLREGGFADVTWNEVDRLPIEGGRKARLTRFRATIPMAAHEIDPVPVEGWLAVWPQDGTFRIAGGAHPIEGLDRVLAATTGERIEVNAERNRQELLDLIAAVG